MTILKVSIIFVSSWTFASCRAKSPTWPPMQANKHNKQKIAMSNIFLLLIYFSMSSLRITKTLMTLLSSGRLFFMEISRSSSSSSSYSSLSVWSSSSTVFTSTNNSSSTPFCRSKTANNSWLSSFYIYSHLLILCLILCNGLLRREWSSFLYWSFFLK